jgi:hypothetical protein
MFSYPIGPVIAPELLKPETFHGIQFAGNILFYWFIDFFFFFFFFFFFYYLHGFVSLLLIIFIYSFVSSSEGGSNGTSGSPPGQGAGRGARVGIISLELYYVCFLLFFFFCMYCIFWSSLFYLHSEAQVANQVAVAQVLDMLVRAGEAEGWVEEAPHEAEVERVESQEAMEVALP